jgi:tetratricopeptide (TPR) repeat protein
MSERPWAVGDVIDERYEVKEIHRGGMATVYIVLDRPRNEYYAAKRPHLGLRGDEAIVGRFLREADTWAALPEHANVVAVRFVSRELVGAPVIFLEYVEGGTLTHYTDTTPLNLLQFLDLAIQFATGLDFAYREGGLLHRDIKPDNALVSPEGLLKVTDFGLAKALQSEGDEAREVVGTLAYSSIEQLRAAPGLGAASDVYSFGVTLYEMFTGRLPFESRVTSGRFRQRAAGWIEAQRNTRPAAISKARHGYPVPAPLNDVVQQCLDREPAARPQSFSEVRTRLIAIYEEHLQVLGPGLAAFGIETTLRFGMAIAEGGNQRGAIQLYDFVLNNHPRRGDAWHNKANALLDLAEKEPTADAEALFRSAMRCSARSLELEPGFALAWNTRGGALLSRGRLDAALECFDRAVAMRPDYGAAWYNKGTCLRQLDRHDQALLAYDQALKINPGHANAWSGRGNCLGEMGWFAEAVESMDRALAIDPHHSTAKTNRELWAARARGENDHATIVVSRYPGHNQRLHQVLGGTVRCPRQVVDVGAAELADKAWGLKNVGRYEEALETVERAIVLDAGYSTAYLHKGRILRLMGRIEEALAAHDHALELDPDYELVWLNRGLALVDLGRFDEGMRDFDRYVIRVPGDHAGWQNKGYALLRTGRAEAAIECFDEGLKINPRAASLHLQKASAFLLLGSLERARESIAVAAEIEPADANVLYVAGEIDRQEGRLEEALQKIQRALAIDPQLAGAWESKAVTLATLGQRPESVLEACRRAADLGLGKRIPICSAAASALSSQGRFDEALPQYEKLTEFDPGEAMFWRQRAHCLARLSRWSDAAEAQVSALRLLPENRDVAARASDFFQLAFPELKTDFNRAIGLLDTNGPEAYEIITRVRNACPNWWEIAEQRAILLVAMNQFEEAAAEFEASLAVCTLSAQAWYGLGVCQHSLNRLPEACASLRESLKRDESHLHAWQALGTVLEKQGQADEAARCFARVRAVETTS